MADVFCVMLFSYSAGAQMNSDILFDAITVARQNAFAFDVWYANHYLASGLASGSYSSAQCYGSPLRATYLAVFEASPASSSPGELPRPQHESILSVERYCARYIGGQKAPGVDDRIFDAPILYPVFFRVPADRETEFNAWYVEEHLPILLRCPYWPACRRFRIVEAPADSWTHMALHYLTDLRALESAERTEARATPWRARLAAEEWFRGEYRVYYRHGERRTR